MAVAGPDEGGGEGAGEKEATDQPDQGEDRVAGTEGTETVAAQPAAPPPVAAPKKGSGAAVAGSGARTQTSTAPATVTDPSAPAPTPVDIEAAPGGSEKDPDVTVTTEPESEVIQGPSPVDGRAVMVIGATQLVMLGEATRHARSLSLLHAVQLGDHLFGARSYAVLEGPLGTSASHFWAVATAPTVTDETIGTAVANWELEGQKISTFAGFRVLPVVTTLDGHRYGVNLLWTKERGWVWGDVAEGKRWIQLSRSSYEHWLSAEELKILTFQEIDRLVDAGLAGDDESLEKAAAQLGEMNAKAFSLVDEETRARYLEVLVKAWTFEEQRHAIIQIMISLDGLAQLQTVRDRLIQAGLYEQLFADLGSDLWDLLTAVGKKFGDQKSLTVREFIGLVAEALNLSMRHDAGLTQNVEAERTAVIGLKKLVEIEEAVRAATGFVLGTLESFKIMLTQPEKILSGLWELHKLTVSCYMAQWGDPVSTRQIEELLRKVGGALVDGLRGAALFGIGPRALTRIKWAVIIEALTWITEIKAAVEALVKLEKVVSILRFLKMLKVFEGEQIAARFTRLAEALHGGSAVLRGLKDEHAVAELLIMLPEEDGVRLGAVLSEVEVPKGSRLAELMEHPRLGPVLAEIRPKAEVLRVLGAKSGGLTPELAQTFARLTGKDGFTIAEVAKVAEALQEGEGARFATMLEEIGFGRIGAQSQVKADLLAMLAGDSRRMDAVHQYGIGVVGQMHARSAGRAEAFDVMLARLEKLRAQHVADGKAVEFSELVGKLGEGQKGAWRRVDRPLKAPRPKAPRATAAERAPVRQRIKELRERYPKNTLKDPKAMDDALRQIARMSETDPAKAMEHLENFEDLLKARGTTEGHVAEIVAEAEAKASREAKALHHEPDEAPPERLTTREKIKTKTGEAGSPSHQLTEAMEAIGQHKGHGNDAHHALAASDRRAEPVRETLEWAGVNPDADPLNGVYLPRTSMDPKIIPQAATRHQVLHTDNYYKEITRRIVEARKTGGADGVIHEMSRIKEDLLHGWHPPAATGTNPENFAQWFAKYRHNLEWLTDAEQLELLERVRAPARKKRAAAPKVVRKAAPRPTGPEAAPQQPPVKARAKPKATVEPKAEVKSKSKSKAKGEVEARPKSEPKPKPKSELKAEEARPKVKAKPKTTAKAKAKVKSKAKTKSKVETKPKAKRKAETKRKAPEAAPKSKPKAEVEPEPATTPEPQSEPDVHVRVDIEGEAAAADVAAEPAAAGPRVHLGPEPHIRVGPKPQIRVDVGAEDVAGEPLFDVVVVDDAPKPEQKKKRAHRRGGGGS
ncbi:AHH domain-containing protein [Streptomyces sp. NPDC058486]